ncbi:MAG: hypothetical protein ACYC4I_02265 [Minisyncoccota bacterium]
MKKINIHFLENQHPITVGFFTLLMTVVFGMSLAFATGLTTPTQVFAQLAPPCCVVVPPPPIIVQPLAPVANLAPAVVKPTCSIAVSASSIPAGSSATLSWSTSNATSANIDNGIGAIALNTSGSSAISPSSGTTYTLTASGEGGTVTCSAHVTVTTPPPPPVWTEYCTGAEDAHPWQIWAHDNSTPPNYKYIGTDPSCAPPSSPPKPTCTLAADPAAVTTGGHSTLSWTTTHADTASLDQGIGAVTPVASGTASVSPTSSRTTYTLTASGPGGTVTCPATVTVTALPPPPPPPGKPSCTLSADPTAVTTGGHATLSWTTTNAATFSIDNSIGSVTPVAGGATTTPALSSNTTFTGTATDASGNTAVCTASVTISGGGGGGGPTCIMTASPSSISSGDSATLAWGGREISSVDIDNSVAIGTTSPGSTSVAPTAVGLHIYKGTFHANNGQTLTCSATVQVAGRSGGCTGNCGGDGGSTPPTITLASLPHIGTQPLAYLYLSQIPYTGLDLGPVGTTLYWIALVCFALAAAYLILFGAVPFVNGSLRSFASRVSAMLNAPEAAPAHATSSPVAPQASQVSHESQEKIPEAPRGYSSYEGFRSFAHNGALSIEDLVKGLSREHAARTAAHAASQSAPAVNVEPIYENVEIVSDVAEPSVDDAPKETSSGGTSADIRGFAAALIEGDRAGVFAGLRQYVRGGGVPERLVSSVAFLIDDTYRARIDGTQCDAGMARLTARLDTPTLEKLVVALTTAIDSSYSDNVAGAKLALTRALAVLGA